MALINIFKTNKSSIGGIALDAVLSESHESVVTLTENEIELGAAISDHAIIEPHRLEMEAYVTDTPFVIPTVGSIIDGVTNIFGSSNEANLTRTSSTFNELLKLQRLREGLDIQTRLFLYTDMVLVSLAVVQDKSTSRVLALNLKFQEARILESQIVQIDPELLQEGGARNSGSPEQDRGRVEPVEPSDATEKTALKTLSDWIN